MKKIFAFLALSLFAVSCGDPTAILDDFTIRIKPNIMDHLAMIDIKDADDPLTNIPNLQMTIDGPLAGDVYEISGAQQFTLIDGRITIGIHPRINPTPDNPVRIPVVITGDGYLSKRRVIEFNAEDEVQLVEIPLVSVANPPTGVSFSITPGISLTGGSLPAPQSIVVPPGQGSTTGMEIDLDAGTTFFDRQGNAISGSNLEVVAGHFDSDNESSMNSFPGGFSADSIQQADGSFQGGSFQTAGFTTLEMTVDGQEVKSFNQPITVTMEISPNALNPNTGQPIALGDIIPVWSYDEVDGKWVFESDGTVQQGPNGLEVSYQTTHLSYWNLDYFAQYCPSRNQRLVFDLPGWPSSARRNFRLRVVWPGTNQVVGYWAQTTKELYDGYVLNLNYVPNRQVEVKIFDLQNNQVGSSGVVNLCGAGDVPITVNATPPVQSIFFSLEAYCPTNTQLVIRPQNFPVYYRESGTNNDYSLLGWVIGGQGSTDQVTLNSTYDFRAYYGGVQVDTTVRITQTNYQITLPFQEVCDL